jgi:excisionase family DNA binding protein
MDTVDDTTELRTLTLEQLEAETGIQAWRIRELIKQGKGPPHFRLGRRYRFKRSGVKQWLDEQTSSAKEG